jgi:hypothetical protein
VETPTESAILEIKGMKSRLRVLFAAGLFCFGASAATEQKLNLEEVLGLVRTNLAEVSEAELSHSAALGLIQQLGSKVRLVTTNTASEILPSNSVSRATVYGRNFGYFRVGAIGENLAGDLDRAWQNLASSNRLKGAILDLRYAKGSQYRAAAEAADLFVLNEQSLMRYGDEEFRSRKSGTKIKTPLAVLINRETSGAAEALAAALREAGAALIIGGGTAGEARLFETFDLSTGQKLRIGTQPIQVGGKPIPATGVIPDIAVNINSLDERAYFEDPFLAIPRGFAEMGGTNELAAATNRPRRFNEAELVRRHRDGFDLNASSQESSAESDRPVIMDPTLARAVDFLKGLAALRPTSPD